MLNFSKAEFIKSAATIDGFIKDRRPQVAFAGRSNVGKSSTINKLLNRKNFARVGSAPGKTIHVNYFLVDSSVYFADLPGYGYAKVSAAEKKRWSDLMESYFESDTVTLGVLIVDLRHEPTADDIIMANWFMGSGCGLIVAANKSDKVKASEMDACLSRVRETLKIGDDVPVVPFSAEKGMGREVLIREINKRI